MPDVAPELQFSDEYIRANVAAVFARSPHFWRAVEHVAGKHAERRTGTGARVEAARRRTTRDAAEELAKVERDALVVVIDLIEFAAERLVAHRELAGELTVNAISDLEEYSAWLRELPMPPADALKRDDLAATVEGNARRLSKHPDRIRAYVRDAPEDLARVDLVQRGAQMVWAPGDAPLTARTRQPRYPQVLERCEILHRILEGQCAVPGCGERARVETAAFYEGADGNTERKTRPGARPICCEHHDAGKSRGDGYAERTARSRVRDLLKSCAARAGD
ncbi:MAG TPA: hypothetical protein VIJ66_07545 [Solirubrobacteraceae bacterium]